MASTGVKYPGTATVVSVTAWGGVNSWANKDNILSDDGNGADSTFNSSGDESQGLYATNFDFSAIPDGATINGVFVEVERKYSLGNQDMRTEHIQLTNGVTEGSLIGTAKGAGFNYGDAYAIEEWGGAADVWGASLTAAIVKGSGFGVALSAKCQNGVDVDGAYIDFVRMTVTYTPAGSESSSPSVSPSASPSVSPSASYSPSVSASVSPSLSESKSPSLSASASESISPSLSESVSESISESVSESISPSASYSPSTSESISPSLSESISESISESVSESLSESVSPSLSESASGSASPSPSQSESVSESLSPSVSSSISASVSPSLSESISPSISTSLSPSVSESASSSLSESLSESSSISQSASESVSPSISESISESVSESVSESASPSASYSPSISESVSESISESLSESVSESLSPSLSESASESVSESISESVSESISPSISESVSASISKSVSSSASPSLSPSYSPSLSPSGSPSGSSSSSPSLSPSASPSVGAMDTYIYFNVAGQYLSHYTQGVETLRLHADSTVRTIDSLVIPKADDKGIKVDINTPTFGWRDILGEVKVLSPGANDPTLAVFRDNIRQFSFSNSVMNETFMTFHIPHDYVIGTDIYIHAHWSQNTVDSGGAAGVPGDVKWQFEVSYSKGHNQAAFPASFTTSLTQTASATQYQHLLGETQLSAASPSATQIDSDILEPDGVILVRAFRDPTDAADTLNQIPFLHYVDIHYMTTNIGTKQKTPDFYT